MRFYFRNPIEIQFKNDDFGIKRMMFKFFLAGLAVVLLVALGVWYF